MFDPDVIAPDHHGFRCEYTPTIMNGPVFRWKRGRHEWASASRDGVMLNTPSPVAAAELGVVLKLLELARATHDRLAALGWMAGNPDSVKQFLRDYKHE